jgi:hypothetical protein
MNGTNGSMSGSKREQHSPNETGGTTPSGADSLSAETQPDETLRDPARRRALAKLGLASAAAYVAPSLTRIDLAHGQTLLPTPCPPPGGGIPRPPGCPPGTGTPGGGPPGGPS